MKDFLQLLGVAMIVIATQGFFWWVCAVMIVKNFPLSKGDKETCSKTDTNTDT